MSRRIPDFISSAERRNRKREKGELPPLPSLSFGFEDSERDLPFQAELERSRQLLEPAWKTVEVPVLSAFEEVTHSKWWKEYRRYGIRVLMREKLGSTGGGSDEPIRLSIRHGLNPYAVQHGLERTIKDTNSLLVTLTHELSHHFSTKQDGDYVEDNFAQRIDRKKLRSSDPEVIEDVCAEVQAEVVWKAVVDRCFPRDVVESWLEQRRGCHKGLYDLIDTLSEQERDMIVDRSRRKYAPLAPKRFFRHFSSPFSNIK